MAAQTKVGSFTISGTGSQTRIELGFQPTGALIFTNRAQQHFWRNGECTYARGITDGTTSAAMCANWGLLLGAVETAEGGATSAYSLYVISNQAGPFVLPITLLTGNLVFDATGFTPYINTNVNSLCNGQIFNYIVFGGDIVCKVGQKNLGAAGTYSITGVPFAPTGMINFLATDSYPSTGQGAGLYLGLSCKCDNQQNVFYGAVGGQQSTSNDHSYQDTGYFSGAPGTRLSNTAWNSDGITFTTEGTIISQLYYLMIGNCSVNVGTFNQPASIGLQNVPILEEIPRAAIIVSFGKVTSTSLQPDVLASIGASDGTNQRAIWTGSLNGQSVPYKVDEKGSLTKGIILATPTGNLSSTLNADASISLSLNTLGVNWSTVDAVARECFYLVIGDLGQGATAACGVGAYARFGGIHKLVPAKTNDTYYLDIQDVENPTTFTVKIPDPYWITFPLHDDDENILHTASTKLSVKGSGELELSLLDLDSITEQVLSPLTMASATENEPVTYANFQSQRTKLKGLTDTINEIFNIDRIIIFVKKLWTDFPK